VASVIVPTPTDLAAGRPEDPEDRADDDQEHTERPQDADAGEQSDEEQHESEDDHGLRLLCKVISVYPPVRILNRPFWLALDAKRVALTVGEYALVLGTNPPRSYSLC